MKSNPYNRLIVGVRSCGGTQGPYPLGSPTSGRRESADAHTHIPIFEESVAESADSTADSVVNPLRIGLWVRALSGRMTLSGPIIPLSVLDHLVS